MSNFHSFGLYSATEAHTGPCCVAWGDRWGFSRPDCWVPLGGEVGCVCGSSLHRWAACCGRTPLLVQLSRWGFLRPSREEGTSPATWFPTDPPCVPCHAHPESSSNFCWAWGRNEPTNRLEFKKHWAWVIFCIRWGITRCLPAVLFPKLVCSPPRILLWWLHVSPEKAVAGFSRETEPTGNIIHTYACFRTLHILITLFSRQL